jgi:hypothetical protein
MDTYEATQVLGVVLQALERGTKISAKDSLVLVPQLEHLLKCVMEIDDVEIIMSVPINTIEE